MEAIALLVASGNNSAKRDGCKSETDVRWTLRFSAGEGGGSRRNAALARTTVHILIGQGQAYRS